MYTVYGCVVYYVCNDMFTSCHPDAHPEPMEMDPIFAQRRNAWGSAGDGVYMSTYSYIHCVVYTYA